MPVSQVDRLIFTDSWLTIMGATRPGPVFPLEIPPGAAAQSTDTTCGEEEVSLSNNWPIPHPLLPIGLLISVSLGSLIGCDHG